MMTVRIRVVIVLDERRQPHARAVPRGQVVDRDDAPRVRPVHRSVHTHDHEEVDAREIGRRDAELSGELRDRLAGAVGMQRRPEGVTMAERLEHADRFRSP